ncbi:MAG: hypothetical protein F6K00_09680 [Leptolyngbya sp. SIOISBB]|nr:hypothetical protein [Leptolyngbya sp. SIOISBB]
MQANHPWYWRITECQQGPDYYFLATFAPQDSPQLAALVQRYLPQRFVRNEANTAAIQYLDDSTYRKLQALQQGEDVRIWFSATIEVLGPELSICHRLGGGQDYAEASLIRALAQAPELTLCQWRVSYGGDGYAGGNVAQGDSPDSLLAYLNGLGSS